MSASVSVRRMSSRADKDTFLRLPWKVFAHDPDWVPPLVSSRRDKLEPQGNPMYEHLDLEYFIAWRGEEAVGCIAAYINHHHNTFHHEHIGWFGLFDVLDDREAALALLQTAEEWVRSKGYDGIRGPASFGDLDEFGLQVEGFGAPHVILMPYNPPYYKTYLEEAGFVGVMDMVSYRMNATRVVGENIPPKILRVMEKVRQRRKITIRNPDMKHFEKDMDVLFELYKSAWEDNWGFVPPTRAEADAMIAQFKRFVKSEYVAIAEINGEPAGFIALLPDLNQALAHARPHPDTPEWITLLKTFWHWKIRSKITRTRVPLLGVVPQHQGLGIDPMLYMSVVEPAVRDGIQVADFGWILDNNLAMNQIGAMLEAEIYKRYRMYDKQFGGQPAAASEGDLASGEAPGAQPPAAG